MKVVVCLYYFATVKRGETLGSLDIISRKKEKEGKEGDGKVAIEGFRVQHPTGRRTIVYPSSRIFNCVMITVGNLDHGRVDPVSCTEGTLLFRSISGEIHIENEESLLGVSCVTFNCVFTFI